MRTLQRFFLCVTCAWCFGGLAATRLVASPAAAVLPSPSADKGGVPVIVEDEWTQAKSAIGSKALSLLAAGSYAALDEMAGEFRQSQAEFADGYWKLSLFYWELGDFTELTTEDNWQQRLTLLRRWLEHDSQSITAHVTLAIALVNYTWYERGSHSAESIPPWNRPLMRAPLLEATQILRSAYMLQERCPYWYSAWMVKAMLTRDSRETYDAVFAEAIRNFPSYTPFYFLKVWRLQERWYGQSGEWEAFAKQSADQAGGEAGDILYARILWYIHDGRHFGNPIGDTAMDWSRAQRGFKAIRRHYPDSLLALSEYCSLSGVAPSGAASLMRTLFDKIGARVDLKV